MKYINIEIIELYKVYKHINIEIIELQNYKIEKLENYIKYRNWKSIEIIVIRKMDDSKIVKGSGLKFEGVLMI